MNVLCAYIGIRGGSNGGLLMGNMLTMRPDLFGAIVCAVPLLDMKRLGTQLDEAQFTFLKELWLFRYNKLLAGASWMAEYGNSDTDDWANYLHKYSAYHNIDRCQKLILLSAVCLHSFKCADLLHEKVDIRRF